MNICVNLSYALALGLLCLFSDISMANDILIDLSKMREVKPFVGNNVEAYNWTLQYPNRTYQHKHENTRYAAGLWNPLKHRPVENLLAHAKKLNTRSLRFPGGAGSDHYDWKGAIGPIKQRKAEYLFGVDEFMQVVAALDAIPIITLSFFDWDNQYQADFIEYLAAKPGSNPNGGTAWADVRAANGHPEPYPLKYVEFGNEVYLGDKGDESVVIAEDYARRYLAVRTLVKNINPDIQLGAVLKNSMESNLSNWDLSILKVIKSELDFAIIHFYPMWYQSNDGKLKPDQIFHIALSAAEQIRLNLESYFAQMQSLTGKKIPLAITEFNGGFVQKHPQPYRHSLGNALLNLDMLRAMSEADVPIITANYWQFSNNYWGILYNPQYMQELDQGIEGKYIKRPNYYALYLYAKYFTGKMLQSVVFGDSYTTPGYSNVHGSHTLAKPIKRSDLAAIKPQKGVTARFKKQHLQLDFSGAAGLNYAQKLVSAYTLKASHRYRLKAKVKSKSLNSKHLDFKPGLLLQVEQQGKTIASRIVPGTQLHWTPLWIDFETSENASAIDISLYSQEPAKPVSGRFELSEMVIHELGKSSHGKSRSEALKSIQSRKFKAKDWSNLYDPWGVTSQVTQDGVKVIFKGSRDPNYYHAKLEDIRIDPRHRYRLSGKIKTAGLTSTKGVYLEVQDQRGWNKTKWAKGTQAHLSTEEWESVNVDFVPPTDSQAIKIMIRRQSGGGKIAGQVKIKDVLLEDLGYAMPYPATEYLSTLASIDEKRNKLYLLVINKHLSKTLTAKVWIPEAKLRDMAISETLNGPTVDANNEASSQQVVLKRKRFKLQAKHGFFRYRFQPHSVTALELELE